jgi:iron complex outermembrane receptor protein
MAIEISVRSAILLGTGLPLLVATPASAQTAAQTATQTAAQASDGAAAGADAASALGDIVVTARKRGERAQETPISLTVATREMLRSNSARPLPTCSGRSPERTRRRTGSAPSSRSNIRG